MMTPEGRKTIQQFLGKLTMVWFVMLGAVAVYVVVTLLLVRPGMNLLGVHPGLFPMFTLALALISLVEVGMTMVIHRRFKSPESLARFFNGKGATAINVALPDPVRLDDDKLALAVLPHYFQSAMIQWALIEVVGVYGLALAFLTGQVMLASAFYLVAAAILGWMKPSIAEIEEMVATVRGLGAFRQ
jgi:hypothetical protein